MRGTERYRRSASRLVAAAIAAIVHTWGAADAASAAVAHVVQPGETLWSIAAANNLTTATVAAYNGISEDSYVYIGQTIDVPTVEEGAAALAAAGIPPAAPAAVGGSPAGLDPAAAATWEQMRQASLAQFGVDLYPDGPLSGYRTYEQQAYLYDLYLSGQGAPANPPGSSTHELGLAVDVAEPVMRDVIDQIGPIYGWYGIGSEWWHVEYAGG
jgi:LysM repeat protein